MWLCVLPFSPGSSFLVTGFCLGLLLLLLYYDYNRFMQFLSRGSVEPECGRRKKTSSKGHMCMVGGERSPVSRQCQARYFGLPWIHGRRRINAEQGTWVTPCSRLLQAVAINSTSDWLRNRANPECPWSAGQVFTQGYRE